ncbi:hypothetical protein RUND412_004911 [Rhizina undulata]
MPSCTPISGIQTRDELDFGVLSLTQLPAASRQGETIVPHYSSQQKGIIVVVVTKDGKFPRLCSIYSNTTVRNSPIYRHAIQPHRRPRSAINRRIALHVN